MKAYAVTALIFITLIGSLSIVASSALPYGEPSVGVKEGDWIEYDINVAGTGTPPPTHDVRWMRITVLQVQGPAFSVNLTARYANSTVGSAVWKFNFTEGNVGGWIIIPSNLGPGDTFYDSSIHNHKPVNVTIQSQEQKTVLGATRTVTYGNDSLRHKEWDKTSGVFVGSSETYRNITNKDGWYIDNLTVTVQAVATNMWSPEIPRINPLVLYAVVAVAIALAAVVVASVIVSARNKTLKKPASRFLNTKVAAVSAFVLFLVVLGAIAVTPMNESQVPLSFRDINLIMQTLWMSLVLVSMWFRKKGNYLVHGIIMVVVVSVTLVTFSGVLVMSPPNTNSMQDYFSSPANLVEFGAHCVLSIPAIAFGVWLVALWRPKSASFPDKSKRAAQLTTVFWVLSYIAGVVGYVLLHTTIFT